MIRVAVFGGDNRGANLDRADAVARVKSYEGNPDNAERIAQALARGTLTHVVVLTRWMDHAQFSKLKTAATKADAEFITWTRGIGELKKELELLATAEAIVPQHAPMMPEEKVRCFSCRRIIDEPVGTEFELCTACAAPVAKTTMAIALEKAMAKQEDEMGEVVTTNDDEKRHYARRGLKKQVLEAFTIDAEHEFTSTAMTEFIYGENATAEDAKAISVAIKDLRIDGEVEHSGGTPKSSSDPARYRLAGSRVGTKTLPAAPPAAAPPIAVKSVAVPYLNGAAKAAPKTDDAAYLVVFHESQTFNTFTNRDEAVEAVRRSPGAALFKQIKLRVVVEIDE